jgi:N-glycosylase/DNA lyase
LPGTKKVSRLGGNNRKLEPKHTDFLCQYYDTAAAAVLWEARDALLSAFPDIQSITLSGLHKHLVQHASLTLKKLDKIVAARNSENTVVYTLIFTGYTYDMSQLKLSNCVTD